MTLYIENNKDILGVACDYVYINNEGKKLRKISSIKHPISCGILYNKKKLKPWAIIIKILNIGRKS